jgi:hypothetical protein
MIMSVFLSQPILLSFTKTGASSLKYELKVKDIAKPGHVIHYVRVPTTSSNQSFKNSKEWFDTAI